MRGSFMTPAVRDLGSQCTAALFAGDALLFALADGTVHHWAEEDRYTQTRGTRTHSALLSAIATPDRTALLTTGEDGRVCRTDRSGEPMEVAAVARKWVNCVAASPQGHVAFATGRSVWLQDPTGGLRELQHPRNVAGIGFSPDGACVAVARYGGITLHTVAGDAAPAELEWKGIYADLGFSPDGNFLLAFMQDETLHGWRLAAAGREAKHFRMTGYLARIRDWSWSRDGRWLATSGAPAAVLWPFDGPDGPMGSTALEVGKPRGDALVSAVACHPSQPAVAIGYTDGALAVASIDTQEEHTLRPAGRGAVTSLAWHAGGARLAFGSGLGECGVLEVPWRFDAEAAWTRP
jgi:WD40 repeat protein